MRARAPSRPSPEFFLALMYLGGLGLGNEWIGDLLTFFAVAVGQEGSPVKVTGWPGEGTLG
jgi:hypothetical protein